MPRSCSCLFILLYLFTSLCYGQQSARLSDGWQFYKGDLGSVWEAVRPVTKAGPENMPAWQSVSQPHCWNAIDAVDSVPNYYQGAGWYRRNISIANPYPNGRTILYFEGAGQRTSVYVFDTLAGTHDGGYDAFAIDITGILASRHKLSLSGTQGQTTVVVRVDNSRSADMIPSNLSDFIINGGLYRHVSLQYLPSASIATAHFSPVIDSKNMGFIDGFIVVRDDLSQPKTLRYRVIDPRNHARIERSISLDTDVDTVHFEKIGIRSPVRWAPGTPALYTIQMELIAGADTFKYNSKIGFRDFRFADHGPFYLNGQRLLLQGTHRHEDIAGKGAALSDEDTRAELILIKQMGANFIRLGHYQQSDLVLDLCDSLGILVWEEIPWCRGGLGGASYQAHAKAALSRMIDQHYNHPSIIIWGLGNENDWPGDFPDFDKARIRAFMSSLNELSHQLDTGRKTAIRRCDFCRDIVDVYSPTIWNGWYKNIFTDYRQSTLDEQSRVDHFFHAEWGADSHSGRHSETIESLMQAAIDASARGVDSAFVQFARLAKNNDWSETYACHLFDWHLKEQLDLPTLTGSAFWTFKDFATPLRPENPVPYINQKGVVQRDGQAKESFYVVQSYWSVKPMIHIYGHNWPTRWGTKGERKLVTVYSNCDRATLIVNGKALETKRRKPGTYPAGGLFWNVNLNEGVNDLTVIGTKGNTTISDSLRWIYQTAQWKTPARLRLTSSVSGDTATVLVEVLDDENILCLDAGFRVRFSIAGGGKLIDNLGTMGGSSIVELANGRAFIRVLRNTAHSVVGVGAGGLEEQFIDIK